MSKFTILPILLLALASLACGQELPIQVEIISDRAEWIPGEELEVGIRITNLSGRKLVLGRENDWFQFNVENNQGRMVDLIRKPPLLGEFEVESGTRTTRWQINLADCFDLQNPGTYRVSGILNLADWGTGVPSSVLLVEIIPPVTLWKQSFGVPQSASGPDLFPMVRMYAVQQLRSLDNEIRLYFRLSDGEGGRILALHKMGRVVGFSRPQMKIDAEARLHVLHQFDSASTQHTVYNSDGELVLRHRYDFAAGLRPTLSVSAQGDVQVGSGIRVPSRSDYPESTKRPELTPTTRPPILPPSSSIPRKDPNP